MTDVRALAADAVITIDGEVVLLRRAHDPHEGEWVLPGGLVEPNETAKAACVRETREEVGLEVEVLEFIGLYDAPGRDARGNVSAAFRCRRIDDTRPRALDEATAVGTFPPAQLPGTGFDHAEIVADALQP